MVMVVDGIAYPRSNYGDIYIDVNGKHIKQILERDDSYYYGLNGLVVTEMQMGDVVTVYLEYSNTIRGDGLFPFTFMVTLLSEI